MFLRVAPGRAEEFKGTPAHEPQNFGKPPSENSQSGRQCSHSSSQSRQLNNLGFGLRPRAEGNSNQPWSVTTTLKPRHLLLSLQYVLGRSSTILNSQIFHRMPTPFTDAGALSREQRQRAYEANLCWWEQDRKINTVFQLLRF